MVVTKIQRKLHLHAKDKITNSTCANDRGNGSTRSRHGKQFSRKSIGLVFSCGLGNNYKRSPCNYSSLVKKKGLWGDDPRNRKKRSGRASSNKLENDLVREDEPVVGALSQLLALENTLEHDRAVNRKHKKCVEMNLPLLNVLNKKNGWYMRRKASLRSVVRFPSRILVLRLKLKMIRSLMKKKVTKQFEGKAGENLDEGEDRELCKKRILMGRRCKPLSSSGTLCYDTNGLLLPEMVTPSHP